ncbi:hypothetical protein [Chitinimonas sp.]|uniref:hypothetical protein n=1 Tax=Chitinimonas sp. TaxID=1934313 RepID=UPI0035B30FA7
MLITLLKRVLGALLVPIAIAFWDAIDSKAGVDLIRVATTLVYCAVPALLGVGISLLSRFNAKESAAYIGVCHLVLILSFAFRDAGMMWFYWPAEALVMGVAFFAVVCRNTYKGQLEA